MAPTSAPTGTWTLPPRMIADTSLERSAASPSTSRCEEVDQDGGALAVAEDDDGLAVVVVGQVVVPGGGHAVVGHLAGGRLVGGGQRRGVGGCWRYIGAHTLQTAENRDACASAALISAGSIVRSALAVACVLTVG